LELLFCHHAPRTASDQSSRVAFATNEGSKKRPIQPRPRAPSIEAKLDGLGDVPREDRRDRIANLPFSLPQLGVEDEAIGKGLEASGLPHGNTARELVMKLDVSVALCSDGVPGPLRDQPTIALLRTLVCTAPHMVKGLALGEGSEVIDCSPGCYVGVLRVSRVRRNELGHVRAGSNDDDPLSGLRHTVVGRMIEP